MFLIYLRRWRKWLLALLLTLIVIILTLLSHSSNHVFDWTNNQKNSISAASISMLNTINQPVYIRSYTAKIVLKNKIKKLIGRYQQHKADIQLEFIDPALQPDVIRKLGIQVEGELVIELSDRTEHLTDISEATISNSLLKLSRKSLKKVYFIIGHGERSYLKRANFDLSTLASILKRQGFILSQSNIFDLEKTITTNDIIVLADPKGEIFEGEMEVLIELLEQGANLFWLIDPKAVTAQESVVDLQPLAEYLGIELADGVIVDPQTQALKLQRPDFAIISEYNSHPISAKLQQSTLFPQAIAIDLLAENNDFELKVLLLSSDKTWLETSEIKDKISFDQQTDTQGPLILAVSLQREREIELSENQTIMSDDIFQQRIVIVGDGDFISNQYLGNGANMVLGLNIFNWLSEDEQLLSIPVKFYPDQRIELSNSQLILLGVIFLIVMPLLFLIAGFYIAYQRRK
ncbi:MAG: Gldg family protein [Pseudomonadota bacterium]